MRGRAGLLAGVVFYVTTDCEEIDSVVDLVAEAEARKASGGLDSKGAAHIHSMLHLLTVSFTVFAPCINRAKQCPRNTSQ